MSTIAEMMHERIKERLETLGISARHASMKATGKPDAIRSILNGVMPSAERLDQIASALNTTSAYLLGGDVPADLDDFQPRYDEGAARRELLKRVIEEHPLQAAEPIEMLTPAEIDLARRTAMPKDIPVYGTAVGSNAELPDISEGVAQIERTTLNSGEIIDYLRRPPPLRDARKVYSLYVQGFSMEPAFEPGSVILVDPSRPPQLRDFVVVFMRGEDDANGGISEVLLKRLVRRSASFIELEQFNPAVTFRLETSSVREIHRVLTLNEIVGI